MAARHTSLPWGGMRAASFSLMSTTVLDIKEKPVPCNGLLPHTTLPFVGERYSLVFFTLEVRAKPASGETLRYLRKLGFRLQSRRRSAACLGAWVPGCLGHDRRDLLPDAAQRLRAAGFSRKHIGDYENRTIDQRYRRLWGARNASPWEE